MSLPTVADLKAYLRIETDAEDALLAQCLARAAAILEAWIDTPLATVTETAMDRADGDVITSLVFPRRPASVTLVQDADGATVDSATYWAHVPSGMVYAKTGDSFPFGPYTLTALVGLPLRQDWARLEPLVGQALLDLAADLVQRRTPGAASETAAGTTISWDVSRETVARVMKTLRLLKLGVAQ